MIKHAYRPSGEIKVNEWQCIQIFNIILIRNLKVSKARIRYQVKLDYYYP